jgi:hypothetical protein
MRVLVLLTGVVAAIAGSYLAFTAIQAVGPDNRIDDFGYGDAATRPPDGGSLMQTNNFARVVTALQRELGDDGALQSLTVELFVANAVAHRNGALRYVDVDASGRSRARDGGTANLVALVPVNRLDAAAIDRIVATTGPAIERLTLQGNTREWNIQMRSGEPDAYVANLDGSGVRIPGEPNPEPVGASPDSMLRAKNLARVLDAASEEGTQVYGLDVRPERVSLELEAGGRRLYLDYGYDAQLMSRDIRAAAGAPERPVPLAAIDPGAIERMARTSRRAVGSKGLGDVQYALLQTDPRGWSLYLAPDSDPPYVVADLRGRRLSWPGRG